MQVTASTDAGGKRGAQTGGLEVALLPDRALVRVSGPEARSLLQGLVTQDLDVLDHHPAAFAALLSPQGKILFDFFVVRSPEGLLLETARDKAADLMKRLTLYRLRAKVTFEAASDLAVHVVWGDGALPPGGADMVLYLDPRLAALGQRAIVPASTAQAWSAQVGTPAPADAWQAHRVRLGVPEGGRDFAFGDAFPHEADMDQLAGVSFRKGCYVGQEVVSRMQHRGTARKRFVQVTGDDMLAPGTAITAGGASIGAVTSVADKMGIALLRLDRAAEAKAKGEPLMAGAVTLDVIKPAWATFDLTPPPREASHDL